MASEAAPLGTHLGGEKRSKQKFLARQRQLRAPPRVIRATRAASVPARRLQPARGASQGHPLPPAGPGAAAGPSGSGSARPGWRRPGEPSPAPAHGAQRRRRLPVSAPPVGRPREAPAAKGGGAEAGHPAPGFGPGPGPEGGHFPPFLSPCRPSAPRAGPGAGSCPPPAPTSLPAPGFLLRATLPRNFPCFVLGLEMIYGSVLDRVSARRQEPSAEMCYVLIYPSIMDGNK